MRALQHSCHRRNEAAAWILAGGPASWSARAYLGINDESVRMKPLYSHVDLRVRNRERALAFYDPLMLLLGFKLMDRKPDDEWPTWRRPGAARNDEFFGFEVDPDHVANQTRIAFTCGSKQEVERVAEVVAANGALNIDGPPGYDDKYYACFFDDPDGNKLEACYLSE